MARRFYFTAMNYDDEDVYCSMSDHNLIYDDDYGCEAGNVIHAPDVTPEYLETAIPDMIKDALSQDTRIVDVYDFEMEFKGDEAFITFSVDTIYGETQMNEVF